MDTRVQLGSRGPRKRSPCQSTMSRMTCWHKTGWIHGFMLLTPNEPTVCASPKQLRSVRPDDIFPNFQMACFSEPVPKCCSLGFLISWPTGFWPVVICCCCRRFAVLCILRCLFCSPWLWSVVICVPMAFLSDWTSLWNHTSLPPSWCLIWTLTKAIEL